MRLTSETAILKAQGRVGKRKDRSIISRGSHRGVLPARDLLTNSPSTLALFFPGPPCPGPQCPGTMAIPSRWCRGHADAAIRA